MRTFKWSYPPSCLQGHGTVDEDGRVEIFDVRDRFSSVEAAKRNGYTITFDAHSPAIDVEGFAKRLYDFWIEHGYGVNQVSMSEARERIDLDVKLIRAVTHAPDERDAEIAELKKQNADLQTKLNAFVDIAAGCTVLLTRKDGGNG